MGLRQVQLKVLDRLFDGDDEKDILAEEKVSRSLFERWFRSKEWLEEYIGRVKRTRRRAQLILAIYQETAAAKLVALMACEKEVTARQACLDILNIKVVLEGKEGEHGQDVRATSIEHQKAAELLRIMASSPQAGAVQANEED